MDVDPMELAEKLEEKEEAREKDDRERSRLNAMVAITIALLATFMGLTKVKDDNTILEMNRSQARRIDDWNFYQSKNIREEVLRSSAAEIAAVSSAVTGKAATDSLALGKTLKDKADHERSGKEELEKTAEKDDKEYDKGLFRHEQFDVSDAALSVSISLLAITSLTRKKWMYWLALIPTIAGIVMGLAGLLGWNIHPEALIRWLS